MIEWQAIWERQDVLDSHIILQDSRWATLSLNIQLYNQMMSYMRTTRCFR